ncbi:MAG: malectin domain-containing carbohydrate-binding protein [Bacteroidota bacterium]
MSKAAAASEFILCTITCFFILGSSVARSQAGPRKIISLNNNWSTTASETNESRLTGFEKASFITTNWKPVSVPHNWDGYEGFRRLRHGNRHGYAWYRKTFRLQENRSAKKFFLFFEGVSSYATVWLNGRQVGFHAGGRTSFTLDVTSAVYTNGRSNLLAVRADHPANIQDLPWVCGGCSDERGFSEGSQPMGIFRPVQLMITNEVKIEPFGVHAWNDTTVNEKTASIHVSTEIKNYGNASKKIEILNRLVDRKGREVAAARSSINLASGKEQTLRQDLAGLKAPQLWSTLDPYLYTLVTTLRSNGVMLDELRTQYGIRKIKWQVGKTGLPNVFLLNNKPVFINGIAEYEHQLGNSHAFSAAQIKTRVQQIKAAGFNALRDAHQPHNLAYQQYWDSLGILWWTQQSAHVWYDTPGFRKNFLTLLTEWVRERRNSPSVIMWGLQNESKLPEDFAKECTELIRQLDPTASSQRLVSTCNGGSGTDWDVPQNWTGTYGGDPLTYGADLKKQVLVGEYGAWRTIDLHSDKPYALDSSYSENRMTHLMETKLRLAESVKDSVAGHFMWLLTSHDNPGRVQGGEGYRELDKIGPVNYKGLLTPWEEPLDAFYMYRSNCVSKHTEPMVYIVSHTWPDRVAVAGSKHNIDVYSNCDEVELFNDINSVSFGKRKRNGIGTHFTWDTVSVQFNVLYAIGYVNGRAVARDTIVLNHLPAAPGLNQLKGEKTSILKPTPNYTYLYRVNCGGPAFTDEAGQLWQADRALTGSNQARIGSPSPQWGASSWSNDFPGMSPYFASQRSTHDPIKGTRDWSLFQSFRFGREKLRFDFPVPDGEYLVELFFIEPWLGTGGGLNCTGWRLFDVAINEQVVLNDLDIWKLAGHDKALKKSMKVKINGGQLSISFPTVASGQAVISAIAISTLDKSIKPYGPAPALLKILQASGTGSTEVTEIKEWLSTGVELHSGDGATLSSLPGNLFGATWIKSTASRANKLATAFQLTGDADVFIAVHGMFATLQESMKGFEDTKTVLETSRGEVYHIYKKRMSKGAEIRISGSENNPPAGANDSTRFVVIALPATTMEPAYDLKPVLSLKAANATLKGPGLAKGQVDGKDRAIFSTPSTANVVEWNFNIGAADIYSFTISYNNPDEQTQAGVLQLLEASGKLLKEEPVSFTKTRVGKSNYINSTSGSMINAGNYLIRLLAPAATGLSINALDIQ